MSLLGAVLITALAGVCRAEKTDEPAKENAELRQRVERLEKELAEIKQMLSGQAEVPKAKGKPAEARELTEKEVERIAALVQSGEKKPVTSSLDVEVYGRLKLDAAYDTSRSEVGNYMKWVSPEGTNKNDDEFSMTANETRLGVRIRGPEDGELRTSGRVEVDFYGGGSENKSNFMMRHAYMNLDWPEERFSIIAGQTSDVISPLVPYTLNYSVAWWAGNIGYRRPQIRLTKSYALANDVDLKLEGALARTIGISSGAFVVRDAGEDAGIPGFQSRASLKFPWIGYKRTTVGFSGHWAKEEYDTTASGSSDKYDSWSLNLDVTQPINEWLAVKGELFTGENLSAYLGGVGQGVNTVRGNEIGSTGGWVAASLTPCPKWNFNLGASIDDPENGDLSGMSGDKREYNRSIFGNVIYSVDKNTQVGFELSQWHTEYQGDDDGDALRAQASFIYNGCTSRL